MSKIHPGTNVNKEESSDRGRFRPGRSGNPRGRPKGSRSLRSELAGILKERIGVREGGKHKRISRQHALLLKLLEQALGGDIRAASTIINNQLKLEPQGPEQAAPDRTLSDDDAEIVADFLRRNQPSN
jgi:hypothetical protein